MVGTASTSIHFVKWSMAMIKNFFCNLETGMVPGCPFSIQQRAMDFQLDAECWKLMCETSKLLTLSALLNELEGIL